MTATSRREFLHAAGQLAAGLGSMSALGVARAESAVMSRTNTTTGAPSPPQVAFLSREDGAMALTRVGGDTYYADMHLLECRGRTQSTLPGLSVQEARIATRDYDAAAARTFTSEECHAISAVLGHVQRRLAARAPLYARTPWSFIKLAANAEGGMPHTRGPHIVMPDYMADAVVQIHRELAADAPSERAKRFVNVLVHEQTHVLERTRAALFEPLFTDVFGFSRMTPAPTTPWLDEHRFINPDGPDVAWAFALAAVGGQGWVMPDIVVPDVPIPRMPQDFDAIGIEVLQTPEGWKIVEENGLPKRRHLDAIAGYDAHFPFPEEDFHPHEIAAVALSHWILQDVADIDSRALMPAIATWAKTALA